MIFGDEELNEFRTEALEFLEETEKCLLALEGGGDFKSNFDSIFRVFHNLKGSAGMMGLQELGQLMHHLENQLNSTKEVQVMSSEQIESILKGVDQARGMLVSSKDRESNPALETPVDAMVAIVANEMPAVSKEPLSEAILEFLVEAQEISQRLSQTLQKIERESQSEQLIDSIYRDIHTLKGGAYLFDLKDLGDLNHSMESVFEGLRQKEIATSRALIDALFSSIDLIELSLLEVKGQVFQDLHERIHKSISFFKLYLAGNKMKKTNSIDSDVAQVLSAEPLVVAAPQVVTATQGPASDADKESGSSIRVPVYLLDKLITLMGEMVLVRNQVIQYSNRTDDLEFQNLSQRLDVVTGEIQSEMMKTRMQPIGNVLTKFSRLVRELSKDLDKKIELNLSGNETELDKTLLEAVKDPLTHIVRNSCDHGIETPAERRAQGKPEVGHIAINSFHEGGQVIIEIADDGKGLHRDKLLKKAIEKGIVTVERSAALSDNEIINLIFAPGFSTAAQVTNVSGRGVGMDVVRTNIEKIGGSVEIQSEAGKGTRLRLKIPLTLAIVPAMIVKCNQDFFAIPQLKLVELVRVEKGSAENEIEFIQGHPVYRLRGNILPLIHIQKVLGSSSKVWMSQEVTNIVVLKSDQHSFGLIVDEIQDTADIVVKPLARFLKPISVFSGATVLGDGAIALILDVAGIVKDHIASGDASAKRQSFDSDKVQRSADDLQDFLLLRVGSSAKHSILLGYVHRLEEFKKSVIEISGHKRLVRYRGSVLPLISVDQALGLAEDKPTESDFISVVVIEKSGSFYGLEVKEVLDVLNTDASLDTTLVTESGVIGNLITDQEIVVVIDPYRLIQTTMGLDPKTARSPGEQALREQKAIGLSANTSRVIRKILYVEDAAFFRRHVSRALLAAGFDVTMANNGKEAEELLSKSNPEDFDLILSDIEMPRMNGFELAESIRKNSKWSQIPMIALSTRSDQKHVERGYAVGFNAYLEKMNGEELLQTIADFSKGSQVRGVA